MGSLILINCSLSQSNYIILLFKLNLLNRTKFPSQTIEHLHWWFPYLAWFSILFLRERCLNHSVRASWNKPLLHLCCTSWYNFISVFVSTTKSGSMHRTTWLSYTWCPLIRALLGILRFDASIFRCLRQLFFYWRTMSTQLIHLLYLFQIFLVI